MSNYQQMSHDKRRAEIDANKVRSYWEQKGFAVAVGVVFEDGTWRVVSDLVNGAPQGTRKLPLAEGWG